MQMGACVWVGLWYSDDRAKLSMIWSLLDFLSSIHEPRVKKLNLYFPPLPFQKRRIIMVFVRVIND